MRCVSVTLLLCLTTVMLTQVTCQIKGRANCLCLKTSKRIPLKQNIESYMIQTAGVCHIDAILFKTFRGRFICADPNDPLAKEAREYFDNKKKAPETTVRPIKSASTSTLNNTSNRNITG
ncbi:hypothetical protein QQF64_021821 [Cirrhinus molitorella]|uniref:Uncharacterized protein n=2 Tax=Cirrhinus molitorella TaxID=172907 RepID=A0AA88P4Y2_9TELE|nr:hypothetical protein Q8A67_024611 [Cirrhinus molitorella]